MRNKDKKLQGGQNVFSLF